MENRFVYVRLERNILILITDMCCEYIKLSSSFTSVVLHSGGKDQAIYEQIPTAVLQNLVEGFSRRFGFNVKEKGNLDWDVQQDIQ